MGMPDREASFFVAIGSHGAISRGINDAGSLFRKSNGPEQVFPPPGCVWLNAAAHPPPAPRLPEHSEGRELPFLCAGRLCPSAEKIHLSVLPSDITETSRPTAAKLQKIAKDVLAADNSR